MLNPSDAMAILIPKLEAARAARQQPTAGEIHLLEYLSSRFDDTVEVYFQPCFNGDRPDIVLISPRQGVIIIEVKDWNLDLYRIDEKNKWSVSLASGLQGVKSPLAQVFAYKKNFFDVHVNGLLEKSLKNKAFFKIINTYVYFHCASQATIRQLYQPQLERLEEQGRRNAERFRQKQIPFDRYEATRAAIEQASYRFQRDKSLCLCANQLSGIRFPQQVAGVVFDASVYSEFKRLLDPPFHYASEGKPPRYTDRQARLIQSEAGARAKICGLAGSGKTVVLAGRAVNAHKRHGGSVLVLTFNITLGSYIRDKISAVREDFPWSAFDINNYHRFLTNALNNSDIEIELPEHLQYDGPNRQIARQIAIKRDQYFETEYFSNLKVLEGAEIKTRYDTILIDEIQDYKPEWIKIIRAYFLEEGGEMLLFGDEKQNIYQRALDEERRSKVVEGFGKWIKLTKSFRYAAESPIIPLVEAFQKQFLLQDYTLDSDESFQLSLASVGIQAYGTFDRAHISRLGASIIAVAKTHQVHPNDISIISSQEEVLRGLDHELRTGPTHQERTLCSFPSHEVTAHPKYSKSYDKISIAKKIGFNLNSGVMKLSSTHSFKGFESPLVFLLVNNSDSPEMVFTGLTRAKQDLMVLLEADSPYLGFFSKHLNPLDSDAVAGA